MVRAVRPGATLVGSNLKGNACANRWVLNRFSFALMIASADGSGLPIVYRLKRSAVAGRVGYAERKRDIINDWTIIQSKSPLLKLRIGTVRNEAKLIRLIERVEVPQLEDPFSELPTSQWVEIVWIELQHDQAAGGGEDWAIEKVTDLTWSDIVHAGLFWTRAADGQGRFREIVGQPRRPIMTWDMVLHRLVVP